MADKTTLDLIAEEVRRSPLLKRPMGYYLPPVSTTDAALSFLHQVEFQPCIHDGVPDLDIRIHLFKMEKANADTNIEGLASLFADYVNGGEFNFGPDGMGYVTYIWRDGTAWKPSRFVLRPLLDLSDIASVEQGRRRVTHVLEKRDKRPPFLLLRWSQICEALETQELVGDKQPEPFYAELYQATQDAQGRTELWVGALPRLPEKQQPSKNGRLAVPKDNESGYAIQLTAAFLANLLYIAEDAGAAEDGINLLQSYYFPAPSETTESLEEEISALEHELVEKRKRLAALKGA